MHPLCAAPNFGQAYRVRRYLASRVRWKHRGLWRYLAPGQAA